MRAARNEHSSQRSLTPPPVLHSYNMDFNEAFRDMRHLCVINDKGLEKFR